MDQEKVKTSTLRSKQQELNFLQEEAIKKLPSPRRALNNLFDGFEYEQSLIKTLFEGNPKFDRTGVMTISIHGHQSRFNLDNGFPLITTKKVHLKSVIHELLWMIRGETNIKYLVENGISIWSDWPLKYYNQQKSDHALMSGTGLHDYENLSLKEFHEKILNEPGFAENWGELGPVYGSQWRNWEARVQGLGTHIRSIDQIQQVIDSINRQHETGIISRRMLVSAWNPADLEVMAKAGLPPCHCLFQFHSRLMTFEERQKHWAKALGKDFSYVAKMDDDMLDAAGAPIYELDLQLYQRSCDIFLGVPFNIASYAMLLMMVAQVTNCKPGTFIHDYGDLHIYSDHLDQVVEQLSRSPRSYPVMKLKNRGQKIDEFVFDDFILENYNPHSAIKAQVAV